MFKFGLSDFKDPFFVVSDDRLDIYVKFKHIGESQVQELNTGRFLNNFFALDIGEECNIAFDQYFSDLI